MLKLIEGKKSTDLSSSHHLHVRDWMMELIFRSQDLQPELLSTGFNARDKSGERFACGMADEAFSKAQTTSDKRDKEGKPQDKLDLFGHAQLFTGPYNLFSPWHSSTAPWVLILCGWGFLSGNIITTGHRYRQRGLGLAANACFLMRH